MVDKFVLPSSLPEEPADPARITVRPADAGPAFVLPSQEEERAAQPKRTNTTFMDYPEIYTEMRHEAQDQVGKGIGQIKEGYGQVGTDKDVGNLAYGVGNVALGALGYVTSPINAAYRAVIGEPGEQRFGIPKGYTEFAAQLATPGLGLRSLFKPLTPVTKVKPPREGPLADEARLYTREGQETQAGLALKEAAAKGKETPEQVRAKLANEEEIISGSPATTFQAAPNYGLGQLERGVGTTSEGQAALQGVREQQGVARTGALEKDVLSPGNPEEVANDLRASVAIEEAAAAKLEREAIARAEQRVQQAGQAAQQADQAAGGTGFTPDISGQVFQRELAEASAVNRKTASDLWDMIDPQGRLSVNASPVINAEFRIRSNMTLADAEGVTDAERKIQKIIEQYTPDTSFKEMRSLRSFISESMREERRLRGESKAWGRMAQLRSAVEETVAAPFEAGATPGPGAAAVSSDAAERLAAATAATKERAATFKVEPVQGILKPGQGGEPKMTPSAVPGKIIPSGPKGYDTVNAYLRATEGRPGGGLQEVSDALVADMRAHATAVDGSIDPGKLQSWAQSKQDALRAVTERDGGALVQRLTGVQDAGLEAQAATKNLGTVTKEAAAERAAVSKKANEGIFGDLMGLRDKEDISKVLGSVFGSKTAVADARAIMARMTSPEAKDGARRAIADWLTTKMVSNTSAGISDVNILRADQFQSFIREKVAVLRAFGFEPEQIRTMQAIAADMRRSKMSIDATKVPGGSNTAQDLYAMKKFGLQSSNLSKILYLAGGITGGVKGGKLGALVGAVTFGQVSKLREAGIKSVQELIIEGMVNPEVGHRLLGKTLPQEKIAFGRTLGKFGARAARTSILTGGPHSDQSTPAGYADGGTVRPLGREGIKARNKARAVEARERSSLARSTPKAKGKVGYQQGGFVPLPRPRPQQEMAPLGPNELLEGMHDRTARDAARGQGGFGGPYESIKGDFLRPDTRARYPIRNIPIQSQALSAPDPGPVDPDQAAAELLYDYHHGKGTVYAEGGEVEDRWAKLPSSKNIEDRRGEEPLSAGQLIAGNQAFMGKYPAPYTRAPRRAVTAEARQDGGEVNDDSRDHLQDELKRRDVPGGLGPTAGPTVTSTTPVQDIPAPRVNSQGETLPTFALKKMAGNYASLPQRAGRAGMQVLEGDPDYNPMPILETAKLVMGSPSVPRGAIGAGPAIKTWHASPHDFERFDINKIGTGQGAASYGKGIYTAESPAVSGVGGEYWKEFAHRGVGQYYPMHKVHERTALEHLIKANGDREQAINSLMSDLSRLPEKSSSVGFYEDAIGLLKGDKHIGPRVYETNIKAPPGEFLDWDAPLGGQAAVKKMPGMLDAAAQEAYDRAIASGDYRRSAKLWDMVNNPEAHATGEMAYHGLVMKERTAPGVIRSEAKQGVMENMRDAGVPGIRYLDQKSRGLSGDQPQTRNYVINRDDILEIVNKYGWAGLAPLGISVEAAREALKDQGFARGGTVHDDSRKTSKKSVKYGKGMPKAHCGICTHWRKGTCTEVKGTIYASMWCELFKRKGKYQEGGLVEEDPLEAERRRRNVPGGLSATAGPTVTSTTPVQDIPAPKVNAEGETLPTYVLKEMGKGLLGAPEQFTHAAGDLQRRGEYAGSQEDMPYGGPPPEEMPAGAAAALMLYGANAPFPKPGIGVFGGRGALTANKGMLAEAEKMLAAGVPHATIRNRTGWEFGSEGKPKFEISDAESRIIPEHPEDRIYEADSASRATGFRPNQRLEQILHHPALYEAYPWLKDMRTSLEVGPGMRPGASYAPPTKNQKSFGKAGEIEVAAPTYERGGMGDLFEKQVGKQSASDVGARDMLLHEIQHAIQEREGFAPGSNPRQLPLKNSEVETIAKNMAVRSGVDWGAASLQEKQNMIRVVRHRIYKAQAGEAEARNVQTRADSTLPSRPSWETEDIKRENQMIDKGRKLKPGEKPFSDAKIYKSEPEPEMPRTVGRAAPAGGGRSSGIFKDPRQVAREAAEKIAPEHPALRELFGVGREDLYDISQQGRRPGNLPDPLWTVQPPKARGSAAAEGVMNPANEQRILDAMAEGGKHRGVLLSDAWYVMDPAYQRLEYLHGPELAKRLYDRLNTTGAMTSPASGVWDEIRRGTAANMMAHQGQFPLWRDWAGIAMRHRPPPGQPFMPVRGKGGTSPHVEHLAGQQFPPQLRQVPGHLAHKTAHAGPIEKYLERGVVEMGTPKVPAYIPASGVPETGFQTRWMVPDAHISKSLGMGDTRTQGTVRQGASMSMPEYRQIAPWYREKIAEPLGIEAVPAQARQWNLFGPQTGVRTMLGAPKLELFAQRIWERALKEGWDPKVLRDMVLSGGAHAGLLGGIISPALIAGLGPENEGSSLANDGGRERKRPPHRPPMQQ